MRQTSSLAGCRLRSRRARFIRPSLHRQPRPSPMVRPQLQHPTKSQPDGRRNSFGSALSGRCGSAKETLAQRRLDLDTARDQARQSVVQAWGQLEAAKAQIEAATAQVNAAEIALNGVRERCTNTPTMII